MPKDRAWLSTRARWLRENPPDHQGFLLCGICGNTVHIPNMELDHIVPRRGDNIHDFNNLQPTHAVCNRLKGSRRLVPKVTKSEYQLRKDLGL